MAPPKTPYEAAVTPDFLQRTRLLSVSLTALLCMWLFGNLLCVPKTLSALIR
jgi:hypothetical protein